MKTTLKILILLFTLNTFAQNVQIDDQRLTPFIGTWTAQYDQNKVFTITLWREEPDELAGNYKIEILDNNGDIIETWKSNYPVQGLPNNEWPAVIYGVANNDNSIGGHLADNTIYVAQNPNNRRGKEGDFKMTLQNTSNPTTAHWTVEDNADVVLEGHPDHFSVPTDIVLTKQ